MADDDSRRGVSNTTSDANSSELGDNNHDDSQAEENPSQNETDSKSVNMNAIKPTDTNIEEKSTDNNDQLSQKPTADVNTLSNRDSEETRNRLAKAREELIRAREESARARDEVEKAKKDLAVAKQDTTSNQNVKEHEKETSSENAGNSDQSKLSEEVDTSEKTFDHDKATEVSDITIQKETDIPVPPTEVLQEDSDQCDETIVPKEDNVEDQLSSPVIQESQVQSAHDSTDKSTKEKTIINVDDSKPVTEENEVVLDEEQLPKIQAEKMGDSPEKFSEEKVSSETEHLENPEVNDVPAEAQEDEPIDDESGEGHEDELAEGESNGEHDEELVEGEREEGDGEESGEEGASAKPLDDDEDRRNPQYIPKRGGFYEHDDRTREEESEEVVVEEPEVEEKPKKNRSEAIDRWGHDMFDPNQQGPKSDQELVDLYGYDIRQEEGAPRARRRRRYGRGPNKYDRTWEDEDAYSRPRGRGAPRGGPSERGTASGASHRGTGDDRSTNVRPRSVRQEVPRKEDFPALSDQHQEPKAQGENSYKNSSGNWRDNKDRDHESGMNSGERRGGSSKANAISFRRGGGGRTFEEPNKSKGIKPRSDNQTGQDDEHTGDSAPKENIRSPRRPSTETSRGSGASRGTGNRGAGPSRGGAIGSSSRGRGGAPNSRGRRNGENSNWQKDEEGSNRPGQQAFSRGPGAPQGLHSDHRGHLEESRGRGRGKFGRPLEGNSNHDQALVGGVEQMRIEDHPVSSSVSRNQDAGRSKRYSSQRQRMTTPPPANTGAPMQQPPYPVTGSGSAAYYASYNDSPPPNYVSAAAAPLLPMAVAAQGAPPTFIAQPMYPTGPGPAPFNAGPYQGYTPAAAPPAVPVGVPIGSPTQDNMYGGGIMYYDPGRQPIRHGAQPTRRAKAAIPIVAPDNDVDSYLIPGRPNQP